MNNIRILRYSEIYSTVPQHEPNSCFLRRKGLDLEAKRKRFTENVLFAEIGKQANLNQNYDLACSSDQIQIPLVEEEYESWERRYEEDDSTWQVRPSALLLVGLLKFLV